MNSWPTRLPNQPVMSMITSDVTLLVRQMVPSAAVGTIAEFARARPTRGFSDETDGSGTSQGNARIHPVASGSTPVMLTATATASAGAGLRPPSTATLRTWPARSG
jgi:hypothetical protein